MNVILHIRAANLAAFSDFMVHRLNKLPGMHDMCSYLVMKTLKDHGNRLPLR